MSATVPVYFGAILAAPDTVNGPVIPRRTLSMSPSPTRRWHAHPIEVGGQREQMPLYTAEPICWLSDTLRSSTTNERLRSEVSRFLGHHARSRPVPRRCLRRRLVSIEIQGRARESSSAAYPTPPAAWCSGPRAP